MKRVNIGCSIKPNFESYNEFLKTCPKASELPEILSKDEPSQMHFRRYSLAKFPLLVVLGSIIFDSIIYYDADVLYQRVKRAFEYLHEKSEGYNWKIWAIDYCKLVQMAQRIKKKAVVTGAPRFRNVFYDVYKAIDQNPHFMLAIAHSSKGVLLEELLRNYEILDNDTEFLLAELSKSDASLGREYFPATLQLFTAMFPYQIEYAELQATNQWAKLETFSPKISGGVRLKLIENRTEKEIARAMIGYSGMRLDTYERSEKVDFLTLMQNLNTTDCNVLAISEGFCEFEESVQLYAIGEISEAVHKRKTDSDHTENAELCPVINSGEEGSAMRDSGSASESSMTQETINLRKKIASMNNISVHSESDQSSERSSKKQTEAIKVGKRKGNFCDEEEGVVNGNDAKSREKGHFPGKDQAFNAEPDIQKVGNERYTVDKPETPALKEEVEQSSEDKQSGEEEKDYENIQNILMNKDSKASEDSEQKKEEAEGKTQLAEANKPVENLNQNTIIKTQANVTHSTSDVKESRNKLQRDSGICVRCKDKPPSHKIFYNACNHGHCIECIIEIYHRIPTICQDDDCDNYLNEEPIVKFLNEFEDNYPSTYLANKINKVLQQKAAQPHTGINQFEENDHQELIMPVELEKFYSSISRPASTISQPSIEKREPSTEFNFAAKVDIQVTTDQSHQQTIELKKDIPQPMRTSSEPAKEYKQSASITGQSTKDFGHTTQNQISLIKCDSCGVDISSEDVLKYPCSHEFCIYCIRDRGETAPLKCLKTRCFGKIEIAVITKFLEDHQTENVNHLSKTHSTPPNASSQLMTSKSSQNTGYETCSLCNKRTTSTQIFKNSRYCQDMYCLDCINRRKLRTEVLCIARNCTKRIDREGINRSFPSQDDRPTSSSMRCPVCSKGINTASSKDSSITYYECTHCASIICPNHRALLNACYCCCPRCKIAMKGNIRTNTKRCQSCQTNVCLLCKKETPVDKSCICFCQFCLKPKPKTSNPLCTDCDTSQTKICSFCLDDLVVEGLKASCGHAVCRQCKFEANPRNENSCKVCPISLDFYQQNAA